jgi:hypothetical protein
VSSQLLIAGVTVAIQSIHILSVRFLAWAAVEQRGTSPEEGEHSFTLYNEATQNADGVLLRYRAEIGMICSRLVTIPCTALA